MLAQWAQGTGASFGVVAIVSIESCGLIDKVRVEVEDTISDRVNGHRNGSPPLQHGQQSHIGLQAFNTRLTKVVMSMTFKPQVLARRFFFALFGGMEDCGVLQHERLIAGGISSGSGGQFGDLAYSLGWSRKKVAIMARSMAAANLVVVDHPFGGWLCWRWDRMLTGQNQLGLRSRRSKALRRLLSFQYSLSEFGSFWWFLSTSHWIHAPMESRALKNVPDRMD